MSSQDQSAPKQDMSQGIPSADDLESFKASVDETRVMHDHPQPFTDA